MRSTDDCQRLPGVFLSVLCWVGGSVVVCVLSIGIFAFVVASSSKVVPQPYTAARSS